MRSAKQGDRVQVHYVKRFQDGSVVSSRGNSFLELIIGIHHPRLPGLGLALVGLVPGGKTKLALPPEKAYGVYDSTRVHRLSRQRFPKDAALPVGKWVRFTNEKGRQRLIRILEVSDKAVVVDSNHRWAGQALELEIELVTICDPENRAASPSVEPGEPKRVSGNGQKKKE